MKKWIVFALALVLLLALAACDKHTSDAPRVTTAPTVPASSVGVVPSATTVPTTTTVPASSTNVVPSATTVPTTTTVPAPSTNLVPSVMTLPPRPTTPASSANTIPSETVLPTDPTDETIPKAPVLKHFRVVGVKEDGIILHKGYTDALEEIYAYVKTDFKAKAFDTVYMEYYEDDFKKRSGKFVNEIGWPDEEEYTYVLENVVSIRFPVAGEATYG